MDVMVALIVTTLSLMAFFQLFAFGTVQIEKLGYRREAMAMLKGEMEFWRARFQTASATYPVRSNEAENRKRSIAGGDGMEFQISPTVDLPIRDRDLQFQRVQVRVSYARLDVVDTLELETRHYVW